MIRHKNRNRIEVITKPSLSMLGEVKHEVSTARTLKAWRVDVFVNGKLNQSQKASSQADAALATKAMLRTEHLLGNYSAYTRAAFHGGGAKRMAA